MESYIGFFAAFLTTISFVPQALKTIRTKSTDGISLGMYLLFNLGIACWLAYGLLTNDVPLILANSITIMLTATILVMKIKHG